MKTVCVAACRFCLIILFTPVALPAQSAADAKAGIAAAHAKIDAEYAQAKLSPFTAVGVRYFEAGQTARIGANGTTVQFDPPAGLPASVDVTWDGKAFTLTPIAGPAPIAYSKGGAEGVDLQAPRAVGGPVHLKDSDVIALGRFLIESYGKQGNVRLFDPESGDRRSFAGLKWFTPDPSFQVRATYEHLGDPKPLVIMTSRGLQREYYRVGRLSFSVGGEPLRLTALSLSPSPKPGDELFIPFRDATTGVETYSVGRYLTLTFNGPGAGYVIDFNLATNPLCNYSPHYNCPIPPRENVLSVKIRAGEMTYPKTH